MPACSVQALVRAYVGGSTADAETQEPLTDEELQEGLMAGFGARARRKHMQRHAASLASKKDGPTSVSADMAEGHSSATDTAVASSPDETSTAAILADTDGVDGEVCESGAPQAAERGVEPVTGKVAVSSTTLSAGDEDEDQDIAEGSASSEGVQESATEELLVRDTAAAPLDLHLSGTHPNHANLALSPLVKH